MKIVIGTLAAVLLAGISYGQPAQAQGTPPGPYLRSCTDVRMEGGSLTATCRRADGSEERTALSDARRCAGDITNVNGQLRCARPGGSPPPGYGASGAGPAYGRDAGGPCEGLHREARDLRDRMAATINPLEKMQMEGRLREVRAQEDRCR